MTTRAPVVQIIGPQPGQRHPDGDRWFTRDDAGVLWVWCGDRRIRRAPVPEWHDPRYPYKKWVGDVHPKRITVALDSLGMEGPEVDEALGVHNALDTVVDDWETGVLVPSLSELRRLCTLTGYTLAWFLDKGDPPELSGWICERGPGGAGCQRIGDDQEEGERMDPDECTHPATVRHDDGYACTVCGAVFARQELPESDPPPPRHPGPKRKASIDAAKQTEMAKAREAIERARATKPEVPNQ